MSVWRWRRGLCRGRNGPIMISRQNNEIFYYQQVLCKHPCKIVSWKFYNINFSCLDHSNIMDEDCLSVHFRAHIVFKLSSLPSLPSQQIPLHHCKLGQPGHLISDTSSEQANIQYVEWGLLGGRFTHIFSLFCVWFVCEM